MAVAHNKACELEDFADPDVRDTIRAIMERMAGRFGDGFPAGREYRKHWECAMAVRALRAGGALRPEAELLGVGAGNEPTLFHLTRHAGRVWATDLYLSPDPAWEESAARAMLVDPARFAPGPFAARRLVVQHMDALELRYEDASFDGVFSSSSLEHFGGLTEVRRALDEIHRVLRPGGLLTLSTELRLAGPPPGLPGVLLFDRADLDALGLTGGDGRWEPLDALDTSVSAATLATEVPYAQTGADVRAHVARYGALSFDSLEWSRYPHLVLGTGEHRWTSVHLALRKR